MLRGSLLRHSDPALVRDPLLYVVVLVALGACAPYFRYVGSLGDEGVLVHGAVRILSGEVLYRDVFGILPPGGYLLVAGWMKLCGAGFGSVRTLAVGVIAVTAGLTYVATRLSAGSRPLAAVIAVVWALLSQGPVTVVSHHWFATAASMASAVGLLLVVGGSPSRRTAFAVGLFAGVAAMVSSMRGALMCAALLAVLLVQPVIRSRLMSAIAGMAVVPIVAVVYLATGGNLVAAFEDVIRYPALHYTAIQAVPFGAGVSLRTLALVALFPVAFVLVGLSLTLGRVGPRRNPRLGIVLALAVVGLLGSYPRPDHVHLTFTVPLGCPLFALGAVALRSAGRMVLGAVFLALSLAGGASAAAAAASVSRLPTVATARGAVVPGGDVPPHELTALLLEMRAAPAGSLFFFYPYSPLLPYLTARQHVAMLDVMVPGYTSAEEFRETCARVVAGARWLVVDRQWSDPGFLRRVFPALDDPHPPEKRAFEEVLRGAFSEVVHASDRFELRRWADRPPVALCDRI